MLADAFLCIKTYGNMHHWLTHPAISIRNKAHLSCHFRSVTENKIFLNDFGLFIQWQIFLMFFVNVRNCTTEAVSCANLYYHYELFYQALSKGFLSVVIPFVHAQIVSADYGSLQVLLVYACRCL